MSDKTEGYLVWEEGCEDDTNEFIGVFSDEEAAQEGAELFMDGEAGMPRIIFVKCPKGKVTKWKVFSEVRYIASQMAS